jgi:hypothetical protein
MTPPFCASILQALKETLASILQALKETLDSTFFK